MQVWAQWCYYQHTIPDFVVLQLVFSPRLFWIPSMDKLFGVGFHNEENNGTGNMELLRLMRHFFLLRLVSIWPSVFYETFMWCFVEKFKESIVLLMHFRSLMYTLGIHGLGCILHIDILLVWSFSSNSFHVSNLSEESMLSLSVRN
jgi:hypothetical protein